MEKIDKQILNKIQTDFPVAERPYKVIAEEFGLTEEAVINCVKKLKESGIIRRLGATFDSRKLGYTSTLVSAKVPVEKINDVTAVINKYPGVTHNYLRENSYNIWFTLIAPSKEAIEKILKTISDKTSIKEIRSLPAVKFFKVKVNFEME
ncbi:MAG: Lrp/AsnC family transcriptional regulator [Nitrospirae bacterium]|nr:Lrp/AsnC family transcriptional regulator [Nitrospirota bacterium]